MKNMTANKKEQRGVALLFAIGIVALMMMLAITYATSAMTERDISKNSTAQYAAKMLTESALQNVLTKLRYMTAEYQIIKVADIVSGYTPPSGFTYTTDDLDKLITQTPGITDTYYDDMYSYLKKKAVFNNLAYNTAISYTETGNDNNGYYKRPNSLRTTPSNWGWQYVTDGNGELVGRFAFVAYKPMGLLDPFSMTKNTTQSNPKFVSDYSVNELDDISRTVTTAPTINTNDWQTFFINCGLTTQSDKNKNKLINRYFKFPRPPKRYETFWYNNHQYNRFNLCRDWSTVTVSQLTTDSLDTDLRNQTTNIPWFTSGSSANRAQTAANLIAFMAGVYNDTYFNSLTRSSNTDSTFATNYSTRYFTALNAGKLVSTDLLNNENYFPNLRVPYLCEIGLKLTYSLNRTGTPSTTNASSETEYEYVFKVVADVYYKVINYYNYGQDVPFTISNLPISFSEFKTAEKPWYAITSNKNVIFSNETFSPQANLSIPQTGITVNAPGFYVVKVPSELVLFNKTGSFAVESENSAKIYIPRVNTTMTIAGNLNLLAGTTKVDYCKLKNLSQTISFENGISSLFGISSFTLESGNEKSSYVDWQVKDPRNNLSSDNWQGFAGETASNVVRFTEGSSPTGSPNNFTTSDADNAENLLNYNSGNVQKYESDSPVIPCYDNFHPGMLGFVHRGENWRTLNISKVNESMVSSAENNKNYYYGTGGMGDYTDGDANLLDQLCWVPNQTALPYYSYGKINLNNIYKDSSASEGNNATAAALLFHTAADATYFGEQVYGKSIAATPERYSKTRAYLAKAISDNNSSEKKNILDERVGKTIFLSEAEDAPYEVGDTLIVIVLAQSIKDIGSSAGFKVPYRTENGTLQLVTAKKGVWNPGIDQVQATQRAYAILQKDNTGKWQIVRIQYVD